MSIFKIVPDLNFAKYHAASKPRIADWANAIADFINHRFTDENDLNVDTITEATENSGVTIESVTFKDGAMVSNLSAASGFPVWNGVDPSDWIIFMDDFITPAIDDIANGSMGYAVVTDAIGTTGVEDGLGGWLEVNATNTDNNETYLSSATEAFKFDTDKKLLFKCRIKLTEANTDDANWVIGLSDNAAANFLQDDGDGPAASYDGAVFFKEDGDMSIQFETSNAATQVTNDDLGDFVSGTTYNLAFMYDYNDGTTGIITPYLNGVAGDAHNITISGLEEMHIVIGVKAGDTNAESLLVDYVTVIQERR
jgi:hypothetical protein